MRLSTSALAAFVVLCWGRAHAETVQLEPYWSQAPGVLVAPMEIDGHVARLLFDTGAGQTTLTPSFGQTLGCSPHGSISAFRMRGDRIEMKKCGQRRLRIGAHTIEREVASFDLRSLLPAEAPPLDGITGLDALEGSLVTLDLANRIIRLGERPGHGWREGVVRFEREAGGAGLTAFVSVDTPTGALWMLLPAVIPHFYPVLLQRSILLRLQPLLDNAAARRPIAD